MQGVEQVTIDRASLEDVPAMVALVRAAYAPYVERIGREPAPMAADYAAEVDAGQVLLARNADHLLGFLVCHPSADHLLIENLAVDPHAQGAGVGGRLLDRAEAEARALGLAELRLYTNAKMTENLGYYRRRGFHEVDRREEDGYDRVFFARKLT